VITRADLIVGSHERRYNEYSIDSRSWRAIYPTDGILDALSEEFEVGIDHMKPTGNVVIRATDTMNDTATPVIESADNTLP
jgi:hypothetical protein